MIRLKTLLLEDASADKKLRVLFVGDSQTADPDSYARQLLKSNAVTGKIAAKYKATTTDIYKLLLSNLTTKYDVVSIFIGGVIDANADANREIEKLRRIYKLAKSTGAKLITISNPTKKYITPDSKFYKKSGYPSSDEISDWVNSQDISDATVDISNFGKSKFEKNMFYLDAEANREIASKWLRAANALTEPEKSQPEKEPADDESVVDTAIDAVVKAGTAVGAATVALKNIPKSSQDFLDMWSSVAINHQKKYGIPASITLAQAAFESGWGRSRLATQGNNYFGIKCHTAWKGDTIYADDDHPNECFRKYENASESFEDHAKFLMNNSRYRSLFDLDPTDYVGWAKGLKAAGYATSAVYAEKLIILIRQNGLDKYDTGSAPTSKTSKTGNVQNIENTPDLQKFLKLPFSYQDISSTSTYGRKNEPLPQDKYFIIHHTAGRGAPSGVVGVLNKRGLGVQWVVDREGNIYQTLPRGSRGAHILNSALGPNNSNSQGVEVIARNDADILPVQAAAVYKLVKALGYTPNQLYGHGEVNPGHKAATEGQTIKQDILKNWNKKENDV